jgi:hypothetical protein
MEWWAHTRHYRLESYFRIFFLQSNLLVRKIVESVQVVPNEMDLCSKATPALLPEAGNKATLLIFMKYFATRLTQLRTRCEERKLYYRLQIHFFLLAILPGSLTEASAAKNLVFCKMAMSECLLTLKLLKNIQLTHEQILICHRVCKISFIFPKDIILTLTFSSGRKRRARSTFYCSERV